MSHFENQLGGPAFWVLLGSKLPRGAAPPRAQALALALAGRPGSALRASAKELLREGDVVAPRKERGVGP